MSDSDRLLEIWTVYDRPPGYPNTFVARKWVVPPGGKGVMTDEMVVAPTLDSVRGQMMRWGLICLTRSESDDPTIVETWL